MLEVDTEAFLAEEVRIRKLLAKAAAKGKDLPPSHPLVNLMRLWADFCGILQDRDETHLLTWIPGKGADQGCLKFTCMDASAYLAERFRPLAGAVLFSATLKPFDYYQRLSGLPEKRTRKVEVASPFPGGPPQDPAGAPDLHPLPSARTLGAPHRPVPGPGSCPCGRATT